MGKTLFTAALVLATSLAAPRAAWAITSENSMLQTLTGLEYRRLDPPSPRNVSSPNPDLSITLASSQKSMEMQPAGQETAGPPLNAEPQVITTISLMSFGLVGLVAVRRRGAFRG